MSQDSDQLFSSKQDADDHPLAKLLDDYLPCARLKRGQTVAGTVVRITKTAITVDVGTKCEGVVSDSELEWLDSEMLAQIKSGDEVMVYVVNPEGPGGEVILSLKRAQMTEDWDRARELQESKEAIELQVTMANRGGLIVQLGRLRGFIPASQLASSRHVPRISDPDCGETLSDMVGQSLRLMVIEADQGRNRLIFSERMANAEKEQAQRTELLDSLSKGQVLSGQVSNLTDFGAFVDLGGVDGLVHLSELSWKRVEHPKQILKVDQEVQVMVLDVNQDQQRIALSIKRLKSDPWETVAERYKEGQLVECRITRLTKWGAFACVVEDEAIEGLIHISELDNRHIAHPSEVVRPDQVVTLRVVNIDPDRHRLAFSLRQVEKGESANLDWRTEYAATKQPSPESPLASALGESLQD